MRPDFKFKGILKTVFAAVSILLLGVSASIAQVALTAQPQHAIMPDGRSVPMWGLVCGTASGATCTSLHFSTTTNTYDPQAGGDAWQPPLIVVPYTGPNTSLTINLTNHLTFGSNSVPTSLVIVGQLGGGLGNNGTNDPASAFPHPPQGTTWPAVGGTGPDDDVFTPPTQAARVRSFATEVGTTGPAVALLWEHLKPGTYLIESGTHPSIQGPMGLFGVVVVTTAPSGATAGTAYPGVSYQADIPLLMSEIDPLQNDAVTLAVGTSGFVETAKWNGQTGACGDPLVHTCYPPAVNYDPRYYLINGVAFDRSTVNLSRSLFATNPAVGVTPVTGQILLRIVNAGLRLHIPSLVGAQTGSPAVAGFSLIAEDGNPLPGNHRVQNEVLLVAGKTYDVMINAPGDSQPALPFFDRQLSLSTNNQRNGGMQAYLGANNATLNAAAIGLTAAANPDQYYLTSGNTLTVSDPSIGVLANDVAIYGATVASPPAGLTKFNADGTFVYSGTVPVTFNYCGSGGSLCTTVTISACDSSTMVGGKPCQGGAPTAADDHYSSNVATRLQISPPGVLTNDSDPASHPLTAKPDPSNPLPAGVTLNPDGSFTAVGGPGVLTFNYIAVNSQGTSSNPATVSVTFPTRSGIVVRVQDALSKTEVSDYRWIIEEDRTFQINPATQVNNGSNVPSLGTNFHTSYMPLVAQGCVGTFACESGQQVLDGSQHIDAVCDQGNGVCHAGSQRDPLLPGDVHLDPNKRYYISVLPGDGANGFNSGAGGPIETTDQAISIRKTGGNNGTVTVTLPSGFQSGLQAGDIVDISGAPTSQANGKHAVVSVTATGFTYASSGANFNTTAATYSSSRQFSIARDCADPVADFVPGSGACGHGMGGAPIVPTCTTGGACTLPSNVVVNVEPTPFPSAKIAVYVFQDDWPLNGEIDAGGGVDTLATQETGLGGFEITLQDQVGGFGDSVGQPTYDMFGMPLSNSLAGTRDPLHPGNDACPITQSTDGLVGMIVTCPHFESDGVTPSPLEGQALIANLYPGLYEVIATPGADRIAKGEEWLQTNTLDGTKPHEAFIKAGEPAYFQEFGPAGYHVAIGFANPKIINARKADECANTTCSYSVHGTVSTTRISRTPDERLYSSGDFTANSFTQCYVSLGDPDGEDIAFTKCDDQGRYRFDGLPAGTWRVTVFDQWNDLLVDGLSTPVALDATHADVTLDISTQQWRTNLYTRTFFDQNGDGVSQEAESGLTLVPVNIRYRDGSYAFFNNTDLAGFAGFNEIFPFFNWLVVEADTTRFKQTGVHVVYDAGGPADGAGGGASAIADHIANTKGPSDLAHGQLPTNLRVPGAVYCNDADCTDTSGAASTGRIDPPWVTTEGFQGFIGQAQFLEFGKKPFMSNENGGIRGHVVYMSTRPFDDPALLLQLSWSPGVPHVTVNLYQEGKAPDGTKSLKLVDTTQTTSWDDWAQGFRSDGMPNMNCPGQGDGTVSAFFYTLDGSTQFLDQPVFTGQATHTLPNSSQFKCYDGLQAFNQVQPAPYDGMYQFPSVTSIDPATGKPAGTNCTICVPNPSPNSDPNDPNYDPYHHGLPMLPAGKYVVEMVVPPGYELVKEEDKNILIGDNYIAPVTQQFGGFGAIFIMPDQAAVASTYNPNNPLNQTTDLGAQPRHEGDTGSVETFWPCAGQARVVPDYISLFPGSAEVSPFAGATRNLCDRKEVTLEDQMTVLAKFYVFSSTHIAAKYTGIITDDFSSEFDPFAPAFGEKFAVPNLPISFKDFNGIEISRTYSDQWGLFNGMNYSSWEVNPPSPSGYVPTMMVACMNDPGPVLDTRPGSATSGQMITDPLYNPGYSQFCYETPFMPGQTQYMDTPVVPTSAFADNYTPPDCAYPDATPAIKQVDGDGVGPWVSTTGALKLTISALGTVENVPNPNYAGPAATSSPYNQKFISRHYVFGPRPTSCPAPSASDPAPVCSNVTVGGIPLVGVTTWDDTTIVGTVQNGTSSTTQVPLCSVQQRGTGNGGARCGELQITAANGKKSVDTVVVTVGGKAPTRIAAAPNAIQTAIDNALPGDLIIVGPGAYDERVIMWKPVRLQGVGAASVTVNANAHPSGKMDVWRRKVNCLFGLALNGGFINNNQNSPAFNPYDPTGTYTCQFTAPQVDAIPGEPVVGWDSNLNGNLAELLQEPTLMGAYEGAGITVLGKGLLNPNSPGVCDALDAGGCILLSTNQCSNTLTSTNPNSRSNFNCNPSRIDGITFTNSSAGGGGIYLHGWNHNMEVSNNRVYANIGTLTGGITVGQVETTDGTIVGTQEQAFGYNRSVNVHHNSVTHNASIGDEINSTTPASAGGVTFCTGADNYRFNYNWVCGNLSSGDGGGVSHFGFSYNGNISNNWILFNQSQNPTIATNGGGLSVIGVPPDGPVCENAAQDMDCPPQLSDGVGPGLVIDANLILGNTAESGSGGGIRLQAVNGTEVARNNTNPGRWYDVTLTNNIIANNVAGWDGAGVSMQDALRVSFINNTVVNNDSTATAGVLFNTLGAPNSNTPPPNCNPQPDPTQPQDPSCVNPVPTSTPQAAGLVTMRHTPNLTASFPGTITCPPGNFATGSANNAQCRQISYPLLRNNLFWQNRAFHITVGGLGSGSLNQQNIVTLLPTLNQGSMGECFASTDNFWDIGVRGDTGPGNHTSSFTLSPTNSILTNASLYPGGNNLGSPTAFSPGVVSEYCNGARVPPLAHVGPTGFGVDPGIADATVPNPLFDWTLSLTPAATVDEGNNWINMAYGPLSLSNDTGVTLGDYHICGNTGAPAASCTGQSPAVNTASATAAPNHDFFGAQRPQNGAFDIGAVEFVGTIAGGGGTTPNRPTLTVLDNFNRANAFNLGANWSQPTLGSLAAITVNSNSALSVSLFGIFGNAYWNAATFGNTQGAAFTFASTPSSNAALMLKATGATNGQGLQASFVRVLYSTSGGGTLTIATTTNGGGTYTTAGTLTGFGGFANGDTITVLADATGKVYVWKNTTATPIGGAGIQLPAGFTGGGRIGIQLPIGARVDNFAGGTVP